MRKSTEKARQQRHENGLILQNAPARGNPKPGEALNRQQRVLEFQGGPGQKRLNYVIKAGKSVPNNCISGIGYRGYDSTMRQGP
jgi:hypothetical protein